MAINLQETLKKNFGFDAFKEQQETIIRTILEGKDCFVVMPTGGGKSLCYQFPALVLEGTAIIISPLIALMKNQVDIIRGNFESNAIAHFMNSSLTKPQLDEVKQDLLSGKTKMLYLAPEALNKKENIDFLRDIPISIYAVDEAHCISEWGHDFRPEYRNIRPLVEAIGRHPIVALTATATPKVQHDILKSLGIEKATIFKSSFNRPNLFYQILPKTQEVDKEIIRFIQGKKGKSGIIYCTSRNKVTTFAETLRINGIKALPYHAGLDAKERSTNQDAFLKEECEVIVATIAFGMGIDKPDVRYVIHYDMPKSLEGYYQETGRAGRDGGEGICIGFFSEEDLQRLERFLQNKSLAEQEIGKQLLAETAAYARTNICRRSFLLHYFGEEYKEEYCGNCDNCKMEKKKIEVSKWLKLVLEAILELKENFKTDYVISVLTGENTPDIENFGHDEAECFDKGEALSAAEWENLIEQASIAGYIKRQIDNYGILEVTPKGKKYIKKPTPFSIVPIPEEEDYEEGDTEGEDTEAFDANLFAMMQDLRKKVATEKGVPPFVVFKDKSLMEMATLYPTTIEELQNINGVSEGKAKRYGKEFLDLIRQHLEDNDLEKPFDFPIRTAYSKSKLKTTIVQQIDHRVPLEDIAQRNELDGDELIETLESIVFGGTRINLDYELYEIMDSEEIEEIYEYFRTAQSDNINLAIDEFGDKYTEDEIRLVRVKFFSEQAN